MKILVNSQNLIFHYTVMFLCIYFAKFSFFLGHLPSMIKHGAGGFFTDLVLKWSDLLNYHLYLCISLTGIKSVGQYMSIIF